MARKKHTIGYVLLSLFLVTVVILGIVFIDNIKTAFSGQMLYTQEQYEEAYQKGKNETKNNISENKTKSENLKTEIANKDIEILNKESTWQQLQEEFRNETNRNALLNQNISNANSSIASLQELIRKYTGIIPDLLNENECIVAYKVNGKIQSSAIIEKGTTLTSAHIAQFGDGCYDVFNYWQVAGQEVNPIGMVINSNIEFEANVTHRYKIWTTIGTSRTSHVIASWSELPTPSNNANDDKFKCWKINNVDVDLTNITLESNLELVANFRRKVTMYFDYILQNLDGTVTVVENKSQRYYWIEDTIPAQNIGFAIFNHNSKQYEYQKTAFYSTNYTTPHFVFNEQTGVQLTENLAEFRIGVYFTEYIGG